MTLHLDREMCCSHESELHAFRLTLTLTLINAVYTYADPGIYLIVIFGQFVVYVRKTFVFEGDGCYVSLL